jgi:hypothetical protein
MGLIAGVLACGACGGAPANTQTGPIILPPLVSIGVGITPDIPPLVVGIPRISEGAQPGRGDVVHE